MKLIRTILLSMLLFSTAPPAAGHGLIVGTYNIRYDNPGDIERGDSWKRRAPVVGELIRFHQFDVLGTQEAFLHQLADLQELLPEYAHTGGGRDGGSRGEHAAIFYRKDKFLLLDGGDFWLSESPDKPGKGWDADLPRICTWAKLEPVEGKSPFFVFNVHFDHRGEQARLESARLVKRKIKEIAGSEAVILTGDFNADQDSETYRELVSSDLLTDPFETVEIRHAPTGTINGFKPDWKTDSRIDHVFLSEHFKPRRYGVLTDTYRASVTDGGGDEVGSDAFPEEVKFMEFEARLPSDHFPVLVEVEAPRP